MPKYIVEGSDLTSVANAIRTAGGTSGSLSFPDGWNSAINAISGGGGLEYEEGTFSPAEDIARPTISFTNTHSSPPMFVIMSDATGTDDTTTPTNLAFAYTSFYDFTGYGVPSNVSANRRYGIVDYVYRTATNPSQAVTGVTDLTGSGSYAAEYWVSTTGFYPSTASDTRYWRANRTYKWIAVWTPTT